MRQAARNMPPYQRLLSAASDLFASQETIEAAWRIVDPCAECTGADRRRSTGLVELVSLPFAVADACTGARFGSVVTGGAVVTGRPLLTVTELVSGSLRVRMSEPARGVS